MDLKLTEIEEKNLFDEANKTKEEEKTESKSKEQEEFELIIQKRITKRIPYKRAKPKNLRTLKIILVHL